MEEKTSAIVANDAGGKTCPVCYSTLEEAKTTTPAACEHQFCQACLDEWNKISNTCPLCRKAITVVPAAAAPAPATIPISPFASNLMGAVGAVLSNETARNVVGGLLGEIIVHGANPNRGAQNDATLRNNAMQFVETFAAALSNYYSDDRQRSPST